MNDYIERKKAIDRIASCYCMDCEHSNGILCRACEHQDDMDLIDDMPAADVQPVKHGKWINAGDFGECSECHATRLKEFQSYYGKVTRWEKSNYCPNCGARMDGDLE